MERVKIDLRQNVQYKLKRIEFTKFLLKIVTGERVLFVRQSYAGQYAL